MSEELESRKPCHLLANASGTKIFMAFYPSNTKNVRLLIPISLDNVTVQKCPEEDPFIGGVIGDWIDDNLSTIEYHAKQKGLV